jgi:hypothetical protein
MKEADGDLVFTSKVNDNDYLAKDETEYTISQSAGSWKPGYSMTDGATYTIEVVALLGGGTSFLQAASTGTTTVVWGAE